MLSPQTHPVAAHFALRILGSCEMEGDGISIYPGQWPRKAATLLRLLAVTRDRRLTRDEAIELLWPDSTPEAGISGLKSLLHRLRQQLEPYDLPSPIVLDRGWVTLNPRCRWDVDAHRLLTIAKSVGDDVDALEQAAVLLRGVPLPEDLYEDWAIPIRQHLLESWRGTCLRLVTLHHQRGSHQRSQEWAERVLSIDPLDEEAVQFVLRGLLLRRRRGEALKRYRLFAEGLRRELGESPSEETRALIVPPSSLPTPASTFVGREAELAAITNLLARGTTRLLTLLGLGGIGKSRLALEAAHRTIDHYPDGSFFVPLASVDNPLRIPTLLLRELGLGEGGGRSALENLKSALHTRQALLVLDNFEHLLSGATLLSEILTSCPLVSILVTSRAPLRISGEQEFPVEPLAVPLLGQSSARAVSDCEAVRLFVQRAQLVRRELVIGEDNAAVIGAICRQLEGIPLALELAAVHVRHVSPTALLTQLEERLLMLTDGPVDAPPRLRSLRAALDWSVRLLQSEDATLFARLAVFAGGWIEPAASAICAPDRPIADVRRVLATLVDSNLVVVERRADGECRFSMLETVHDYARELLEAMDDASQVRKRHAEFFRTLARSANFSGNEQTMWLARLEADHDNLRAAMADFLETDQIESVYELAASLRPLWLDHAHFEEGSRWFRRLLEDEEAASPRARANLLLGAFWFVQDASERRCRLEQCIVLHRELADARGSIEALNRLADVQWDPFTGGDSVHARLLVAEAFDQACALGDEWWRAWTQFHLGTIDLGEGNVDEAYERLRNSVETFRGVGSPGVLAWVLFHWAAAAHFQGEYEVALRIGMEAHDLEESLGNTFAQHTLLWLLGLVALEQGDIDRAEMLECDALRYWITVGEWPCMPLYALAAVAVRRGDALRAASLWGAAAAATGVEPAQPLSPLLASYFGSYLREAERHIDEAAWHAARDEGRMRSVDSWVAVLNLRAD